MTLKYDKHNIPYRTLFQRFQSPQARAARALHVGDWEMAVALVEAGVIDANERLDPKERSDDVSAFTDTGHCLIHRVTLSLGDDISLLRRLLDAGANPNSLTFFSETAAHYAARGGREDMLAVLMEYGANFDLKPSIRGTFYDENVCEYTVMEHYNRATKQSLTVDEFRARIQSQAMKSAISDAVDTSEKMAGKRKKM